MGRSPLRTTTLALALVASTGALLGALGGCGGCEPPREDAGGLDDGGEAEPDAGDAGAFDAGSPDDGGTDPIPDPFADAGEPPDNIEYEPGAFGGPCTDDNDCESGLCSQALGDRFCTRACTDDDECDPGNGAVWSCRFVGTNRICVSHCADERWCQDTAICAGELELPEGSFNLCIDVSQSQCTADDDCDLPEVCTTLSGGFNILAQCTSDGAGFLVGGEACDPTFLSGVIPCSPTEACPGGTFCNILGKCQVFPNLWCASSLCWPQGTCGGPCLANADCPDGERCRRVRFSADRGTDDPADDGTTFFNHCMPFVGSEDPCATDADCAGGELCTHRYVPEGVLDLVCRLPDDDAVSSGERCGDDPLTVDVREPPAACDTNLCNDDGICVHTCQDAADCGDPGAWQCVGDPVAALYGDAAGICLPGAPCDATDDCAEGEVCAIAGGTEGELGRCRPALGTLLPGTPCDETAAYEPYTPCRLDADCAPLRSSWVCDQASFACVPPATERCTLGFCSGEGYCPERCVVDDDCGHPTLACRGTEVSLFGGFTGTPTDDLVDVVATCRYLPGGRNACGRDADCAEPDESCVLSFTSGGVLEQLCGAVRPDGAAVGEDCGLVEGEVVLCASGLCDYDDGRGEPGLGTCAALCTSAADCPTEMVCTALDVGHRRDRVVDACRRP